jgi:cytoskeletal protein RodZ
MRRQGGGFGFVVMLVVLVIVFYLAMNNFKSVAPAAIAVQKHNEQRKSGEETSPPAPTDDSWTPSTPTRPNLSTMDKKTSEHSAAVQGALSQSE